MSPELRQAEARDVACWYPTPDATSDKYSRGVAVIDTGSDAYPGAAVLTCLGATYAGAGFVRYAGPARDAVVAALPNVVVGDGRPTARLLGSGWGEHRPFGRPQVERAVAEGVPLVLDADAIGLARGLRLHEGVLLTPHSGELARFLGTQRDAVAADPLAAARAAASQSGATVLLKGATQYVARPDGRVWLAVPGPAWTAQAGSGDVLAGICVAMLAAGLPAERAALVAASLQAIAARNFPGPRPPQDLARLLPEIVTLPGLASV